MNFDLVSAVLLVLVSLPTAYLLLLAWGARRPAHAPQLSGQPVLNPFIIIIPAHNEGTVIAHTVKSLLALDYPPDLFSVHVIADHCSDDTADLARQAGATVHERRNGPQTGKGAAMTWGLAQILTEPELCAGVVFFDADTRVDPQFLRVMNAHLAAGDQVIQGQHIISNPEAGFFAALTWAMFLVDNRFQNLGRSNLGLSAKNMGDSICLRSDVIQRLGWGQGLTEDYQLRQKLLLEGMRIVYEPNAKGYGEAPLTWSDARSQRSRWLRGTYSSSRQSLWSLISQGLRRRDKVILDGALQALLPSYSTLTLLIIILLLVYFGLSLIAHPYIEPWMVWSWFLLAAILFCYPFLGLALEHAPRRAYGVIMSGPLFIVWRTWLAIRSRFTTKPETWVRTPHGIKKE